MFQSKAYSLLNTLIVDANGRSINVYTLAQTLTNPFNPQPEADVCVTLIKSLRPVWFVLVAVAGVGLGASVLMGKLSPGHMSAPRERNVAPTFCLLLGPI